MSSSAAHSIGLIVEAKADAETVQQLVDRQLSATVNWATEELLDSLRSWRGVEPETSVTYWKKVPALCKQHGLKLNGKFDGEPGAPDARAARRALVLFKKMGMPDAVVLVRDADNQPERLTGLRQARDTMKARNVALGVAIPEREAWVIAGFEPRGQREQASLAEVRRRLGFDPTRQPHQLGGHGKREAKAVLEQLVDGDHDRQREILRSCPMETLEERGNKCGLKDFLDEVRDHTAIVLTDPGA